MMMTVAMKRLRIITSTFTPSTLSAIFFSSTPRQRPSIPRITHLQKSTADSPLAIGPILFTSSVTPQLSPISPSRSPFFWSAEFFLSSNFLDKLKSQHGKLAKGWLVSHHLSRASAFIKPTDFDDSIRFLIPRILIRRLRLLPSNFSYHHPRFDPTGSIIDMELNTRLILLLLAYTCSVSGFWRLPCMKQTGIGRIDPLVAMGAISDHAHTIHGGQSKRSLKPARNLLVLFCCILWT